MPSLQDAFDAMPVAVYTLAPDGTVTTWNEAAERLYGWRREEVVGQRLPNVQESALGEWDELHAAVMEGRSTVGYETRRLRRDGRLVEVCISNGPLRGEGGEIVGVIVTAHDLGERRAETLVQRHRLRFLRDLLDGIPVPIFYKDRSLVYRTCNAAFAEFLGKPIEEIEGHGVWELCPPELAEIYERADLELLEKGGPQIYEQQVQSADGGRRDVIFNKALLRAADGTITGMVGTILDITERKRAEERLAYQAHHDALTGLPNRSYFTERLEDALRFARRDRKMVGVAFVDLDRFKLVNDSFGHRVGDRLLQQVADRLRASVRATDTLARMGGDEFTVLLPGLSHEGDAARSCERILAALSSPFEVEGRELVLGASIGVSLFPCDGVSAGVLLQRADLAMYRAKENGNCFRLFTPELNVAVHTRLELEADLRQALERGELRLVYQPQIELATGEVVGYEALMRWCSRHLGNVPPGQFIPVAEESGLIVSIGAWALEEACRQAVEWQQRGHPPRRMAVNVSARQLTDSAFVDQVAAVLQSTGLPPSLLELELTESQLLKDVDTATATMERLRALGVRLAIDDFGTGFSSLSRLQTLPLDELKVDRSFIAALDAPRGTQPLVEGIINLAHALGLQVVAEGVETAPQADALQRLGCEVAQGWLYDRALEPEVVAERYAPRGEVA